MSAEFEKLVTELLKEMRDKQESFLTRFETVETRAANVELRLEEHAESSARRHNEILGAFPAGDTDGHRRYHETVIEWRELRNKIVRECLINAAKAGFLAAIGWLLYAIWVAIKMELAR